MADVKVLIVELNGVELEFHEEYILSAVDIPVDNSNLDPSVNTVQQALDFVGSGASPGYTFSRAGFQSNQTWLKIAGGVVSHRAGIPVYIASPTIIKVVATSENANTYAVKIYEHDGDAINLTLLTTLNVVAARTQTFNINIPLTQGKQLAVRVQGNVKNPGVNLQLKGSQ